MQGSCSDGSKTDQNSCTAPNTWTGNTWTPETWTPATWKKIPDITSENACNDMGKGFRWVKANKYEEGDKVVPEMMKVDCHGGSHTLSRESDDRCASPDLFFSEAVAGNAVLTMETYKSASKELQALYDDIGKWAVGLQRAFVVNSPTGVEDRAGITFDESMCFTPVYEPTNQGSMTVNGGAKTHLLFLSPQNSGATASDAITISGGSATILGGTSSGKIVSTSTGKFQIYNVKNSGELTVSGSQDIFIADVTNEAAGVLTVTDVTATLVNVVNKGRVTVTKGGEYNAYNIKNDGQVVIEAGKINIHTVCPSTGTITAKDGVTGTITYESGCKGTITAPAGVTVSAPTAAATDVKLKGELKMTVTDADAFLADAAAQDAVKKGIAEHFEVAPARVELTFSKGRRLVADARNLAGTSLKVDYTITLPAATGEAKQAEVEKKIKDTAASPTATAALNAAIVKQVTVAKGADANKFTPTVTKMDAPTVSKTANGSGSGSGSGTANVSGAANGSKKACAVNLPWMLVVAAAFQFAKMSL